jgi:glycosyltransferase involved in cell wall biosynthesis
MWMRVLHLSWEFPPRIIGGIAAHVFDLSRALARRGLEVNVMTCNFPRARKFENIDGVNVNRFESYATGDSFLGWALRMQKNMEISSSDLINGTGGLDIIHAHDWLSGVAGIGLKYLFRKPLITTMHSTEYGRRTGIHNDLQASIHEIEGWITSESWRVITCSYYMRSHVAWCFHLPEGKICVIPNGVDVTKFSFTFNYWDVRNRFAHESERILLFVGRLVPEKGLDTLINALPLILAGGLNVKLVVVGEGPQKEMYQRMASDYGLREKVLFAGYIDDWTLRALYRVADVAVVPSKFEPFGIVALEAMAAHCPLVTTSTGGLSEIVDDGGTGLKVPIDDPPALARAILRIVRDVGFRNYVVENAYRKCLWNYNWDKIAEWTSGVYDAVLNEYTHGAWKPSG